MADHRKLFDRCPTVRSTLGRTCTLRYGKTVVELETKTGKAYGLDAALKVK